MKRLATALIISVLGSMTISARVMACDNPPSSPTYLLDVVAIDTRELEVEPSRPQSLYQSAREAHGGHVISWPTLEAITRFRVVESAIGDTPDVVEIRHQLYDDGTSCSSEYRFVRGERYFLTPYRTAEGLFMVTREGVFTGEQRLEMLDLLRTTEGRRLLDPTYPQASIEQPEALPRPPH